MTEIDQVIAYWRAAQLSGQRVALASVVHVDGSSYRKPGARMVITERGQVAGAVSGGCVERAVAARAEAVLRTGQPEVMVYDGRHRLGCNGSLYILVEPFAPADADAFFAAYEVARGPSSSGARASFEIVTAFAKTASEPVGSSRAAGLNPSTSASLGSVFRFASRDYALRTDFAWPAAPQAVLTQVVAPAPQLFVVGAEHDAVTLARLAAMQGWAATLVTHPRNPLEPMDGFAVRPVDPPALLSHIQPDAQSAVVLMSHNYARDLAYLRALISAPHVGYLGLLGPAERRDELLNDLADAGLDFPAWMDDRVYGPAGLDLGGELPAQIALSIMAELTAVFAGRPVPSLRDKRGTIHAPVTSTP